MVFELHHLARRGLKRAVTMARLRRAIVVVVVQWRVDEDALRSRRLRPKELKVTFKQLARSALRPVGLEDIAVRIWRRVKPAPEHGHVLLIDHMRRRSGEGKSDSAQTCIEIGTTREALAGQCSTEKLAQTCLQIGAHFYTVDMDIDNTTGAKQLLASIAPAFAAVCSKGEDFLADFDGTIDYLYLDAFDVDHGRHSERRKERYREFLGEELTNSACWKMHLDCVKNCMGKFTPGAVVVFDDTSWKDSEWHGKGKHAIPFMLEAGFSVIENTGHSVALARPSAT